MAWEMSYTADIVNLNFSSCLMGSGTGPADQFLLYGARKASRCDLRSPEFKKFSMLHSYSADRCMSLIAGLKHMKQTMELLYKANGATLHHVLASFVLFHSVRPLKKLQVRLLARILYIECIC